MSSIDESDDKSMNDDAYEAGSEPQKIIAIITTYRNEAQTARRDRMIQNDMNFDHYHMRDNTTNKKMGQSREFLPKQAMAVEQVSSFLHQGLMDIGSWFSAEASRGNKHPMFTDSEVKALMEKWLEDAEFYTHTQDGIKAALLGSLMITKVGTKQVPKPRYTPKRKRGVLGYETVLERSNDTETQLALSLVRPRDWYPDPTGRKLYEIEAIEMDYYELVDIAKANPDSYDLEEIEKLGVALCGGPDYEERRKSRETGQNPIISNSRMRVRIHECWGTLVDPQGEVVMRNCVSAMANNTYLIRRPQPNPYWHQRSPYVAAPIIRVPWSEWHKCLMDAPTMLNRASNELFNLILDSGLGAVFGVKQVRTNYLLNPDKLSGGIAPNEVIEVGPTCPPGVKAVETVSTSNGGAQEALAASNMVNAEFNGASLTNDLRMGVLPSRSVKATEVTEASNSITGTFSSIAKAIECDSVLKILNLAWLTMAQEVKKFDVPEYQALLGDDRALMLDRASPEKRFSLTVQGHRFKVFGLTQTLNKIKDFRKITTFLQTVVQAPQLMDEFLKKYSIPKLLGVIMKSLDIDEDQIKLDEVDELMGQMGQDSSGASSGAPQGIAAQGSGPDRMSQVPQMGASSPEAAMAPSGGVSMMPKGPMQ